MTPSPPPAPPVTLRLRYLRFVMKWVRRGKHFFRCAAKKTRRFEKLSWQLELMEWRLEKIDMQATRKHVAIYSTPEREAWTAALLAALINHPDSSGPRAPLDPDGYDPYGNFVGSWREGRPTTRTSRNFYNKVSRRCWYPTEGGVSF